MAKELFTNEFVSKWIVVTPDSKGEELLKNLKDFECIKAFFIFCKDEKFNVKWAKKIKKVVCITSKPEILCQKFIEFNKTFAFPNFNYQIKENISPPENEKQYEKLFDFFFSSDENIN